MQKYFLTATYNRGFLEHSNNFVDWTASFAMWSGCCGRKIVKMATFMLTARIEANWPPQSYTESK